MLVIDDTGDRKAGTKTAHVARQYLGSVGKIDNGIVAVTSLWADERVYYPLHVRPYTPAARLPEGQARPGVPDQAAAGRRAGRQAARRPGSPSARSWPTASTATTPASRRRSADAGLPYVLALKPRKGTWAPAEAAHTPEEAARAARLGRPAGARGLDAGRAALPRRPRRDLVGGRREPARRRLGTRRRDPAGGGHDRPGDAAGAEHLVPERPTCRGPGRRAADGAPLAPADLAEVVRLYGLRNWVEQGYKQVKGELGWADFQVRADRAIRRHWHLVCCAFSFCWRAWFAEHPPPRRPPDEQAADQAAVWGEGAGQQDGQARHGGGLAGDAASGARLADPLGRARALVAGVVAGALPTQLRLLLDAAHAGRPLHPYLPP